MAMLEVQEFVTGGNDSCCTPNDQSCFASETVSGT